MINRFVPVSILAAVIGALAFIALANHYAYLSVRKDLERERNARFSLSLSLWRYAVVEEANRADRTFIIRFRDGISEEGRPLQVQTLDSTVIAKQELIAEGTRFTGLSAPSAADFADLQPGTNVALLLENQPNEKRVVARVILFGNPL